VFFINVIEWLLACFILQSTNADPLYLTLLMSDAINPLLLYKICYCRRQDNGSSGLSETT